MRVFIVHAHHEPTSFNGALTANARETLEAAGHEVQVSDLHTAGFDPVSDRRNFVTVADASRLKQQVEEEHAARTSGFAPDIQAELSKLAWCDLLILQFPLWWLGMPAILKGWVDRVFAVGPVYGGGRYFSRGALNGKWAMCSVTIGGSASAYSERGAYGPIEPILYPIHHGILGFVGFEVLEPFLCFAPARMSDAERADRLAQYRERLLDLQSVPRTRPLDISAYDGLVRKTE